MSEQSKYLKEIGLQGYEVIGFEEHRKLSILHLKTQVNERAKGCPHCAAKSSRLYSKGPYLRKVKHIEAFGRPVFLRIHTRRYQCRDCSRSFIPELQGIKPYRHSSEPFRRVVYYLQRDGVSGKSAAGRHEIGSATVERIYHEHTKRKAGERSDGVCPPILGLDEHSIRCRKNGLRTGTQFATTLCNLRTSRVFDIVEGRSPAELESYFFRLKGRDKVKVVCIDLSSSYRTLIKRAFPNAKIVADRFHVIRIIQHHFMELFRCFAPEIKHHRGYLAALRTRPDRLSPQRKIKLAQLFAKYPVLESIYQQMRKACDLINQKNATARKSRQYIKQFLSLIDELKNSQLPSMNSLAKTLNHWNEPIACMWRFSKNNGITEGFHRKMKLIQRRAYGFRNFENYRLRVIAECG